MILNGGPVNGGELLESTGNFNAELFSSTIAGVIEIPMGSTEGQWNIRIILEDELENITNLGPNDLAGQNFQNHIIVNNTELGQLVDNLPLKYSLNQNYPNPFNPETSITFSVPIKIEVEINVFDIKGNKIATVFDKIVNAGSYSIIWNAAGFPSGVYFIGMSSGNYQDYKKVMLIK